MAERIYCSELARDANAPLYGTAVQVDTWLLIEYPRPWKPKALADNDLGDVICGHLDALPERVAKLGGGKLRVQFIKQASSADQVHPRVFVASGATLVGGELDSYQAIGEITAEDVIAARLPNGTQVEEEIFLVCTNGQRDLCCARFGLPLFEALRIEHGGRVWQTTHVGGHRYAPNVVCLPSGLVYGFVMPDDGDALVRQHDAGEVDAARLRGRSAFAPPVQAAEVFLRRERGMASGRLELLEAQTKDTETRVRFNHGSETFALVVRTEVDAASVIASCDADPKPVSVFHLESLSVA